MTTSVVHQALHSILHNQAGNRMPQSIYRAAPHKSLYISRLAQYQCAANTPLVDTTSIAKQYRCYPFARPQKDNCGSNANGQLCVELNLVLLIHNYANLLPLVTIILSSIA